MIINIFIHKMAKLREIKKTITANSKDKLKRRNMKWSCVGRVLKC